MNIPKILHYCWFGRKPLPPGAQAFIQGWKQRMPSYQVVEWNESNFDVACCEYVREAYESGRFAFVSDYARGQALYLQGGIYLDTDVEVLKPFDDLLLHRSFWGFEAGDFIATSTFGAVPEHDLIRAYLEQYRSRRFLRADGTPDTTTNVEIMTGLWQGQGLLLNNERQVIGNDNLFLPQAFLSPYDYTIGNLTVSPDAYAIHHYAKTWLGPWDRIKGGIKTRLFRWFGPGFVVSLQKWLAGRKGGGG